MRTLIYTLLLLTFFTTANANTKKEKNDPFVIATDGLYPPYTFINSTGELDGFETELLKKACDISGVNCKFKYLNEKGKHLEFGELLPGLKKGDWNMAYGDMGITDDRINEGFNFIISYKPAKFFFGKKTEAFDKLPNGLSGKTIGVEKNTKFVEYAELLNEEMKKNKLEGFKKIIQFDNSDKLKAALLTGEIQVTPMPDGTIGELLKNSAYSEFSKIGPELVSSFGGQIFGNQGAGFAIKKEDPTQYLIGKALQQMLYDCSYTAIHEKYLLNLDVSNNYLPSHCESK